MRNVTWSNQYLYGTTVNSKTVTGEWIRPTVIKNQANNYAKNDAEIKVTYEFKYELTDANLSKQISGKDTSQALSASISGNDLKSFLRQYIKDNYLEKHYPSFTSEQWHAITVEIFDIEEIKTNLTQAKSPLLSPLGLLQVSDGNIYAFSDRLVEYLVQNVINHLDEFSKDIERIQTYSKSEINWLKNASRYYGDIVPGVWDKDFQRYLFDLVKDSKILGRHIDLTGYADKDTETIITRGQKV